MPNGQIFVDRIRKQLSQKQPPFEISQVRETARHAEICVSRRKISRQMCHALCAKRLARRLIPIVHVKPPRNAGFWRRAAGNVYARHGASGQPRMHTDYTGYFGWNRCASLVVPYHATLHLLRARCGGDNLPKTDAYSRACSVLRSAPGASRSKIADYWPFAAAVRTLRRPRLAGEARPGVSFVSSTVRRLHPVPVACAKLWSAPPET